MFFLIATPLVDWRPSLLGLRALLLGSIFLCVAGLIFYDLEAQRPARRRIPASLSNKSHVYNETCVHVFEFHIRSFVQVTYLLAGEEQWQRPALFVKHLSTLTEHRTQDCGGVKTSDLSSEPKNRGLEARTLLVAPGLTRNKCIASSNKCLTTRNKDATRSKGHRYWNECTSLMS